MKNFRKLILAFAMMPLLAMGQQSANYDGPRVCLKNHTVKATKLFDMEKAWGMAFQGMDIWGNTLVSLSHTGLATLYDFNGKTGTKKGTFQLGSYGPTNHANVASFGNNWAQKGDPLPLLYVSRCSGALLNGMDKLFFGERIDPVGMKSELVQQIWLNDYRKRFGGYALGCIDRQQNMLYLYAETKGRNKPNTNRHWVLKFPMPEYRGPQDSLVILTEDDAIDRYYMEDSYNFLHQPVTQGACAWNGMLFLPMGVGNAKEPSVLYVINTANRTVQNAIDLQAQIPHELEDCTVWNGSLIIQTQGSIYKVEFPQ